jgi:hypothetical protein
MIRTSITTVAISLALLATEKADANSGYCLATAGEVVTNTCGHTVHVVFQYGTWRSTFFRPGQTERNPDLVRAVNIYACDERRGGVRYSQGQPVGCN